MTELLKAIFLGIVEGICEWLPISSTGHMILVDEFLKWQVSDAFREMFLVVVQLGAILAVVAVYLERLNPIGKKDGGKTLRLWGKILFSCIPAAVAGLFFDEQIETMFYNWKTVSVMLILVGIWFLWVEKTQKKQKVRDEISLRDAFLIGLFQLMAAVFPGTSRSGATILGALCMGIERTVATEYTFFLAVPVMLGAGALKLLKFGPHYSGSEISMLLVGMVTAFVVSAAVIRFLMEYIKKHDFRVFGWYRIALGTLVFLYFGFIRK